MTGKIWNGNKGLFFLLEANPASCVYFHIASTRWRIILFLTFLAFYRRSAYSAKTKISVIMWNVASLEKKVKQKAGKALTLPETTKNAQTARLVKLR